MEKLPNTERSERGIDFEHSPESYRDVLFWSFLLSQGNPQIQKIVLDYVVCKVGPFDSEKYEQSLELFAERYFEGDQLELSQQLRAFHKPINGRPETIEREYDWFRQYDTSTPLKTLKYQLSFLDHPPTQEVESVDVRLFSNLLWNADGKYLTTKYNWNEPSGRPGRDDGNDGAGNLKDRWFSFGVYYLIKKHGIPNVPVIDHLLTEARCVTPLRDYKGEKYGRLRLKELNDIIESYNLRHPNSMTSQQEITDYFTAIRKDEDRVKSEE